FKDCSDNSSNEVNTAGSIVPTAGQNTLNSTNTFSAAGPLNTTVSPTYGKSLFIDASQLPDDLDMPELEDITYSNDEDVVGAEADFNNLETSIPVSPILPTRIHKDHPVSQIIGDLSLTTQTRSMTRGVKDQGFQDKFDAETAGKEVDQTYVLFLVWSAGSTNPQNNDEDAAFDGKEHDFDATKPESVVILSSSSSAQSRKQDDKTKKEDKGKSLVESFTGYRDL
nr:hypothetical protein [Tanacetum cinerariifolium]